MVGLYSGGLIFGEAYIGMWFCVPEMVGLYSGGSYSGWGGGLWYYVIYYVKYYVMYYTILIVSTSSN